MLKQAEIPVIFYKKNKYFKNYFFFLKKIIKKNLFIIPKEKIKKLENLEIFFIMLS